MTTRRYKYLHQNIGEFTPARADAAVTAYLRDTTPDFAAFTEDRGQRDVLHKAGYRTRYTANGPGTRILTGVREDHKIVSTTLIRCTETWRGPKVPTRRAPRVYPLIVWDTDDGDRNNTIVVHLPYDGPDGVNAAAWAESRRRLQQRWTRRAALPKTDHLVMLGDFNAGKRDLREHFDLRRGGRVVEDNMLADHLIADESLTLPRGRRLLDVPAHPPYLWTLDAA